MAIAVGLAVMACGGTNATTAPSPSPMASAPATSPGVSPGSVAPSSPGASTSPTGSGVAWDDDLLAVLPAEIDGRPLVPERDAFSASAADPALVRDASAGVVGFVLDPTSEDYAVAFVYALRPGVYGEAWYRAWREAFDEGVCEQAGGAAGTAEAEIRGHPTFIGSCAGGVLTYHTHLVLDGVDHVVSVQALGPKRYGEQVIEDLRA